MLVAYLGKRKPASKDPPYELIVRGKRRGRFPTAAELSAADEEDDLVRLGMTAGQRRGPA
jgi:hypothetical protein